jgi:hypothetical protein
MKSNDVDNNGKAPDRAASDSKAPSSGDSFSVEETETDEQEELAPQIEVKPGEPPAIRNPARLTLVGGSDDDPPDWPDF